jgi:hypothetical protein
MPDPDVAADAEYGFNNDCETKRVNANNPIPNLRYKIVSKLPLIMGKS